ncbi:TetR/AcrR family transcriptional regulator C-terminal domain-containing protein [Nocardia sp. CDC153]|uniref:TetR/AcrR family transcriptional regulator C-terminal domain-containing protein n=1 Tax=Nocardia sp. CDC153 TaxID=3112167 RepID=UPI002DBCD09B|nr:TetR/AcrR family transcriptional regulator C-terminal domain-containing protein [Nocardia sp. CDC153]MEC3956561.1 TetR/AcrR family transcriptional regulator C-terminal domain-containing protein [Nocardia sp. CDC153]
MPAAGLDRDAIARVALAQLDEVGLEALSLRRVAKDLGVHPSALYYHFANKQELLDEMARVIVLDTIGDRPGPTGIHWDDWLIHLARTQRHAARTHRDGAVLMLRARPNADYQFAYLDTLIALLVAEGFTAEGAGRAFAAVTSYAIGVAAAEQQRVYIAQDTATPPAAADHPGFTAIANASSAEEASFEAGLRWLIDGLRADLHTNSQQPTNATPVDR